MGTTPPRHIEIEIKAICETGEPCLIYGDHIPLSTIEENKFCFSNFIISGQDFQGGDYQGCFTLNEDGSLNYKAIFLPEGNEAGTFRRPENIVTYIVMKGDNLSKIAEQFSTSMEILVELNRARYPSLTTNPRYVEAGWVLIVSSTSKSSSSEAPASQPSSSTPGCDVSTVYWLASPITCEESVLDVVSEIGIFGLGCIQLKDENPLGYYMTHTIYKGWILKDANNIKSYSWYVDKEKSSVVVGPAIVLEKISYVECGIPGNP